jgi:hypothetical protein
MFFNALLLGAAAAMDPALIGAVAFMLTRRRPRRLLAVYLVGGFGISMIAGVVVLFVLKNVGANTSSSVPPEIEIAVGVVLLLAAVLVATGLSARLRERLQARRGRRDDGDLSGGTAARAADPPVAGPASSAATAAVDAGAGAQSEIGEKLAALEGVPVVRKLVPRMRRALEAESPWVAWAAGVAVGFPSAYYLAAIALILKSGGAPAAQVAALLVFNLALFAMVWIPLVCYLVAPAATKTRVAGLSAWAHTHRRLAIAVVAGLIGAYLIIVGITKL